MPNRTDRFEAFLAAHGQSRTRPRRLLFRALAADGPQTPAQLAAALAGQVDRATVYRTVNFFLDAGIAVRAGHHALELSEAFRPHHHHLECVACGRSESVDDEALERALAAVAGRHGFDLTGHQVELSGVCAACRAAGA